MNTHATLPLIALLLAAAAASAQQPPLAVRETLLARLPEDNSILAYAFARNGPHSAMLVSRDGRMLIVHDGAEGKPCDWILPASLAISPDGAHVACIVQHKKSMAVLLDGVEGRAYDQILPESLVFSPDGRRFAYSTRSGAGQELAVIDGKESPDYEGVRSIIFSQDGRHVAYLGRLHDKVRVVVDGLEGPAQPNVNSGLAMSPDGSKVAYATRRDERWVLMLNNKPTLETDPILRFGFTPGGSALWCITQAENGPRRLLVDGKPVHDAAGSAIAPTTDPIFSPDGQRLACLIQRGSRLAVVLDGIEQKEYDLVQPPVFSADGRHLAYAAIRGERQVLVLDGHEEGEYEQIQRCFFAPDGRTVVCAVKRAGKFRFVVGGRESPAYTAIPADTGLELSPTGRLVSLAIRGTELLRVEIDLPASVPTTQR